MSKYLIVAALVLMSLQVSAQSEYGGWDGIRGKQTGFYHVEQMGDRWWCVDPLGYAFYAIGTDHVNYNVHWCEALGYAPYAQNVRKIYNNDESEWARHATDRLKDWGFNLLSANNSPSTRNRGLAFTEFFAMGTEYSGTEYIVQKTTWTGFPDVFSPGFAKYCGERAQTLCLPLKDSPWLFGYFLDNELEWFGKAYSPVGLANEAIMRPAETHAKTAFVDLLKSRYSSVSAFNKAWGTAFDSWEQALKATKWDEANNAKVNNDKLAYVRLCAEKYFSITTAAIRRADPNHMILGCRFAGSTPDVVDIAGKYCDIFTINYYGMVDMDTLKPLKLVEDMTRYYKQSGRPLMITEWSFPALDAGLPSTNGAGMRVKTQADKAKAFEVYQTALFDMHFYVGSDYFMWVDEPELGIAKTFPENSNYGLVDVNDKSWDVFTRTVKRVNEKAYRIHSGRSVDVKVARVKATNKGVSVALTNTSPYDCSLTLDVSLDSRVRSFKVMLPGKKTVNTLYNVALKPGGHYVEVLADTRGVLDEVHRGNNKYCGIVFVKGKQNISDAVAVSLGPGYGEKRGYSIRVADLLKKKAGSVQGVGVFDSKGNKVQARILDLDMSRSITPADEVVFDWTIAKGQCATFYFKFGTKYSSANSLVKGKEIKKLDIDLGSLRVRKNTSNGTLLDSLELNGRHVGSLGVMMQEVSGISYWERADVLNRIVLWDAGNTKLARITVSKIASSDPAVGPFAYKAVYDLRFHRDAQWFTSTFVSVKNTDKRAWNLGRYFHYPTSKIGADTSNDEPIPGRLGVLGWMDTAAGVYYGAAAPASSGMSMLFWKDPDGIGQHSDVYKVLGIDMKPGQVYAEKPSPVYLVCADGSGYAGLLRNTERIAAEKALIEIIK